MDVVVQWAEAADTLARAGGWAISLVFIFGMLFGLIRPRAVVREAREDRESLLTNLREEATEWKTAWAASEKARTQLEILVGKAVDAVETTITPGGDDVAGVESTAAMRPPPWSSNGRQPHA